VVFESVALKKINSVQRFSFCFHLVLLQSDRISKAFLKKHSMNCNWLQGGRHRGTQGCLEPCPTGEAAPVDLVFFDPVSDLGMRVSLRAVPVIAGAMLAFGLVSAIPRRRAVASPAA
jgi:hypothetical protein